MKKSMITMLLMVIAMTMSAQSSGVKISAKYQKGDNMLYRMTVTTTIMGKSIDMVGETRYVVTEASPNGYIIENTVEKIESNAEPSDIVGRMLNMSQESIKGVKVILTTDADGKVTGIKNIKDVQDASGAFIDKMLDELMAQMPAGASQMITKDKLKASVAGQITEKNLVNSMLMQPSPFTLNGLTIGTGSTDMGMDATGMKMKNTYTLTAPDGSKVNVASKSEMTKEDMKKLIIEQVKNIMPEQAEMIEQNIDMVMASDAFKMEKNQVADYEFGNNGWLKNVSFTATSSSVGQNSDMKCKIELVESNR